MHKERRFGEVIILKFFDCNNEYYFRYGQENRRESKCSCIEIVDDECWCCIVATGKIFGQGNSSYR